MQSIQKEHGLDDFQKVKKESVLEMVSTSVVQCNAMQCGPAHEAVLNVHAGHDCAYCCLMSHLSHSQNDIIWQPLRQC